MHHRRPISFLPSIGFVTAIILLFVATMTANGKDTAVSGQQLDLAQGTATAEAPSPAVTALPDFAGAPLPEEEGEWFATAGLCTNCHADMVDEAGNDVSNDRQWRSSMMANAARDPYWQASVRSEVLAHPDLRPVIEEKCATCHMPLARQTARAAGEAATVLDDGFLNPDHPLRALAMDGVSCTLCHQIEPTGFGDSSSFSGEYAINFEVPFGERLSYGPFEVNEQRASRMQRFSGYIPVQGLHIQQSEHCATCHMLYTPYVDGDGAVAGEFPEQTPYLEWLNSDYVETQSCQSCHMPEAEGSVQLSNTGGSPREPVRQHTFVGGNSTALMIMRARGEELGATASSAHFDATIAAMVSQLQTQTATVALDNAMIEGHTLAAHVVISSSVGHKFPTSFPSRRAWLHITVRDGDGTVVFESGAFDDTGRIAGNDNDADPTVYEPHYTTITNPDEVQIYEAILGTTEGDVTTTLLRAATYLKDNRIPPSGFPMEAVEPDIAVVGGAASDDDFRGGGDTVALSLDVGDANGPFTITVDLLYQSISYRWAENLRDYDGQEVARFFALYDDLANLPVLVATATVEVAP